MHSALPLSLLDAALRGALLACLLMLALALWRARPDLAVARLGLAMAAGLAVQVVSSAPWFEAQVPWAWQAPWIAISVGNAVLFWLFAQALFDDGFVPRRWHAAAWLAAAGLTLLKCTLVPDASGGQAVLAAALTLLQRAVPLVCALAVMGEVLAHWRADLVEGRRRLRLFVAITGATYTLAMLVARLAAPGPRLSPLVATLDTAGLLLITAVMAAGLPGTGRSQLWPPAVPAGGAEDGGVIAAGGPPDASSVAWPTLAVPGPAAARARLAASPDPAEDRLAAALQQLMAGERVYRDEDLSVASLAARLSVAEYRLRRVINQRLGHRNFNAFVNGWRLADACAALADPARRAQPVLSIALDAGFGSIGPFNRAFKASTGRTPTEFRQEKLADF